MAKGDPVVSSAVKKRMIAAYGTPLTPTVLCTGTQCDPSRPAGIEILTRGIWKPWMSGTLGVLADSSKRSITLVVLPTRNSPRMHRTAGIHPVQGP